MFRSWWHGPTFLLSDVEYAESPKGDFLEFVNEESKIVLLSFIEKKTSIGCLINIEKFCCLQKLLNVTSQVLRFIISNISNSKKKKKR